jgi:hypothetical protein
MTGGRVAFVHEAELAFAGGTDPATPGAAVTAALCGHWEHDGPCRWPHNNDLEVSGDSATFRTLFVAPAGDEGEIRARIDEALREGAGWSVVRTQRRPVAARERPLAARLAATPLA